MDEHTCFPLMNSPSQIACVCVCVCVWVSEW